MAAWSWCFLEVPQILRYLDVVIEVAPVLAVAPAIQGRHGQEWRDRLVGVWLYDSGLRCGASSPRSDFFIRCRLEEHGINRYFSHYYEWFAIELHLTLATRDNEQRLWWHLWEVLVEAAPWVRGMKRRWKIMLRRAWTRLVANLRVGLMTTFLPAFDEMKQLTGIVHAGEISDAWRSDSLPPCSLAAVTAALACLTPGSLIYLERPGERTAEEEAEILRIGARGL